MARSVPQGDPSSFDAVGFAGLSLASQTRSEPVGGRGFSVSDNGATNHITNDSRHVCDWVEIPPGKEKVLIGDGREMRVLDVGILNLKMHSKTDFNVRLNEVFLTEGIGFNLFSLHYAQARQTIISLTRKAHTFLTNV